MKFGNTLLAVAVAAVMFAAAGCGKKEEKNGGASDELSKPIKELLVGTWDATLELDEEEAIAKMKADDKKAGGEATDEELKKQVQGIKEMIESTKLTLTFNADGTSVSEREMPNPFDKSEAPLKQTETETWEVVSEEGKTAVIRTSPTEEDAEKQKMKKEPMEFDATFTDDDHFTATTKGKGGPPGTFTFVRKK